jgi:hypothetical protein
MTEFEFCKLVSSFEGETVDKVKQIKKRVFTGEELKEFIEHCLTLMTI